jgi:hypothetical protein
MATEFAGFVSADQWQQRGDPQYDTLLRHSHPISAYVCGTDRKTCPHRGAVPTNRGLYP